MNNLIFDLDGTLVDSMKQWENKMIYILEKAQIHYPDDIIKTITPLGDVGTAEYFINNLGLKRSVSDIISEMDSYAIYEYTHNIPIKKNVDTALKYFKKKGYTLSVLTASPHRMLDVCLKRNGIYDCFDNVWSCEDFGTTKSDVNIYYKVAKELNAKTEQCIFFDDNINVLKTAKQSGMTVVGVYDESSADCENEIKAICDKYVYEITEFYDKKTE